MNPRFNWDILTYNPQESEIRCGSDILPPLIARFLFNRQVKNSKEASQFLYPVIEGLDDPFALSDMDKAVRRIRKALKSDEKVLLFGDSDIDGVSATAIVYELLRKAGLRVSVKISDRTSDGYGLPNRLLEAIEKRNISLLFLIDCGTNQADEVDYLKKKGIDVIVLDHHLPSVDVSKPFALVNSRLSKPSESHLCSATVAFKLAQAMLPKGSKEIERYLDLAVLGTLGDCVPLIRDNRSVVKLGIGCLSKTDRPGLRSLFRALEIKKATSSAILSRLIPFLNSTGRIGKADLAFRILVLGDKDSPSGLITHIRNCHEKIKEYARVVMAQASSQVERMNFREHSVMVVAREGWPSGLMGPLASQISRRYSRPAVAISLNGSLGTGSCRSFGAFDMFGSLSACSDSLIRYGGHPHACGISIETKKIENFKAQMNSHAKGRLSRNDLLPRISIDADLSLSDLSPDWVRMMDLFEPFGPGNQRPCVLIRDVSVRDMGTTGLFATDGKSAIKIKRKIKGLSAQENYDLVASPVFSNEEIEISVCDFKTIDSNPKNTLFMETPDEKELVSELF